MATGSSTNNPARAIRRYAPYRFGAFDFEHFYDITQRQQMWHDWFRAGRLNKITKKLNALAGWRSETAVVKLPNRRKVGKVWQLQIGRKVLRPKRAKVENDRNAPDGGIPVYCYMAGTAMQLSFDYQGEDLDNLYDYETDSAFCNLFEDFGKTDDATVGATVCAIFYALDGEPGPTSDEIINDTRLIKFRANAIPRRTPWAGSLYTISSVEGMLEYLNRHQHRGEKERGEIATLIADRFRKCFEAPTPNPSEIEKLIDVT